MSVAEKHNVQRMHDRWRRQPLPWAEKDQHVRSRW